MPVSVTLQFRVIGVAKECLFPCCTVCQRKFSRTDCRNALFWCLRCQRSIPVQSAIYGYSLKLKVLLDDSVTWLTLYGRGVDCLLGTSASKLHRFLADLKLQHQAEQLHFSVDELLYHALSATLLGTLLRVCGRWLGEPAVKSNPETECYTDLAKTQISRQRNSYSMLILYGHIFGAAQPQTVISTLRNWQASLGKRNVSCKEKVPPTASGLVCTGTSSASDESEECSFVSSCNISSRLTNQYSLDGSQVIPLWSELSLSLDCTTDEGKENVPSPGECISILQHTDVSKLRVVSSESDSTDQEASFANSSLTSSDSSVLGLEINDAELMEEASALEEQEYGSGSHMQQTVACFLADQHSHDFCVATEKQGSLKHNPIVSQRHLSTNCHIVSSTPGLFRGGSKQQLPKRFSLPLTPILHNGDKDFPVHRQRSTSRLSQTDSATKEFTTSENLQLSSGLSPDLFSCHSEPSIDMNSPELFSGASFLTTDLLQESSLCRRLFEQSASGLAE